MRKSPKKPKFADGQIVSTPVVLASLTEKILKMISLIDSDLADSVKLKMIERILKDAKYEGFKVCQLLPKELLGKRTKSLIYKPRWSFFKGNH